MKDIKRPVRRSRTSRRGFTLVEVIVIVTIMALLLTVVSTTLLQQMGQAKSELAKTKAAKLNLALQNYLVDEGLSGPPQDFDFSVLTLRREDGGGKNGPYLTNVDDINDPWGFEYQLRIPPEVNLTWDIVSYGEDNQTGGEGANEDVTN